MSTIPFTKIEGYLAMPRLHPLGQLPESFGRDWALLPPAHSLRAELKALYAALLRTFCLSDQAIRSLCRWSPLEERLVAVNESANSARATPVDASVATSPGSVTQTATNSAIASPVVTPAYGSAVPAAAHWSAWAGGACVLGGAAVLAWIGFGHLTHRPDVGDISPAAKLSGGRNALSETLSSSTSVGTRADHKAAISASAARARSTPAPSRAKPNFAPASSFEAAPVSNAATASRPALASVPSHQTVSNRHKPAHDKRRRQHDQTGQHAARFDAVDLSSHAAVAVGHVPRGALFGKASNAMPKASASGPYSPLAPSRLGVDEYAGVTMSAATRLRDIAPAPRVGNSNGSSGVSATDWANHLSQRRITDIPDLFAK